MYIVSVEFVSFSINPTEAIASAHLVFKASDGARIGFSCSVPHANGQPASCARRALINDAKRQLLRMPEYRSGRQTIDFPDGPAVSAA